MKVLNENNFIFDTYEYKGKKVYKLIMGNDENLKLNFSRIILLSRKDGFTELEFKRDFKTFSSKVADLRIPTNISHEIEDLWREISGTGYVSPETPSKPDQSVRLGWREMMRRHVESTVGNANEEILRRTADDVGVELHQNLTNYNVPDGDRLLDIDIPSMSIDEYNSLLREVRNDISVRPEMRRLLSLYITRYRATR